MDIPHPSDVNRTLWDAKDDHGPYTGPIDKDVSQLLRVAQKERKAYDTGVTPLGSGSDYTVFLQRLGVSNTQQPASAPILIYSGGRLLALTNLSREHPRVLSTITTPFGTPRHGWRSTVIQVRYPQSCYVDILLS
jgi:hypothetical protein